MKPIHIAASKSTCHWFRAPLTFSESMTYMYVNTCMFIKHALLGHFSRLALACTTTLCKQVKFLSCVDGSFLYWCFPTVVCWLLPPHLVMRGNAAAGFSFVLQALPAPLPLFAPAKLLEFFLCYPRINHVYVKNNFMSLYSHPKKITTIFLSK